jgi:probable phosphoglycerate mutase
MRGLKTYFAPGMPGGRVRLRAPVFFARHGETDWNAERRFQGLSDIPLNDKGRAQARANGAALAARLEDPSHLVCFSSPLSRATETLEIMREAFGAPAKRYRIDDRLIEIDLGRWNGRTYDEIARDEPDELAHREGDKWDYAAHGGESYAAAAARVRGFLQSIADAKAPMLIVGHGASGRILRAFLIGEKRHRAPHMPAPQDCVFEIARGRERRLRA